MPRAFSSRVPSHSVHNTRSLFPQRDPNPEPSNHLDKGECEEDAVLQPIASPSRSLVRRVVPTPSTVSGTAIDGRRRAKRVNVKRRENREQGPDRRLCAPVVKRSQLLGHRKAQQVAEAEEGEDGAQEGEGVALGVEAAGVGYAHALAEDLHENLVGYSAGVGDEDEAEGYVEEGYGCDEGFGGDDCHGCLGKGGRDLEEA